MQHQTFTFALVTAVLFGACSDAAKEDETPVIPSTLRTDAAVSFFAVYQAPSRRIDRVERPWIPADISASPMGELWVVMRIDPLDEFASATGLSNECTEEFEGDCMSLEGSTVAISNPDLAEEATDDNGGARLIVDYNAWHFMRRPSAIAFGAAETWIQPDDDGAFDMDTRRQAISEPLAFTNTFATCHEHRTGNGTEVEIDYIGPSLWTSDPDIYNGQNGDYEWSNGSHLDMLHGTPYCVGIAHDPDVENGYWTFNGKLGTLDFYDFNAPHLPGHWYHEDASFKRYVFPDDALTRTPYVPSNLEVVGNYLYVADTGGGRVVRVDRTSQGDRTGAAQTSDPIRGDEYQPVLETFLSRDVLAGLWGENIAPSGIGVLDAETLVIANYGSGHLTLVSTAGVVIRNIDTGLGAGLGGVTVMGGRIYFTHLIERRVYRLDVAEQAATL